MQCRNCKCEIPPAFVTAIANNSCPGCGKEIMSETDQELMTSLSEAMERMPNDPQGLAGWLLSNYKLHKIGTAEPVERFYRSNQRSQESEPDGTNSKFAERSGFKPKEDLASKIQKLKQNKHMAPLAEAMQSSFEDEEDVEVDEETADLEDQKALVEFGKLMGKNNPIPNKEGIITAADMAKLIKKQAAPQQIDYNEVFNEPDEYEEEVPQGYMTAEEKALQGSAAGRQMLNMERMKRIKGQDALRSGGSGPNGFKRA